MGERGVVVLVCVYVLGRGGWWGRGGGSPRVCICAGKGRVVGERGGGSPCVCICAGKGGVVVGERGW